MVRPAGVDRTGVAGKSRENCQEPSEPQITVTVLSGFVSTELRA